MNSGYVLHIEHEEYAKRIEEEQMFLEFCDEYKGIQ